MPWLYQWTGCQVTKAPVSIHDEFQIICFVIFFYVCRDSVSDFTSDYKLDGQDGNFENIGSNMPHTSGKNSRFYFCQIVVRFVFRLFVFMCLFHLPFSFHRHSIHSLMCFDDIFLCEIGTIPLFYYFSSLVFHLVSSGFFSFRCEIAYKTFVNFNCFFLSICLKFVRDKYQPYVNHIIGLFISIWCLFFFCYQQISELEVVGKSE